MTAAGASGTTSPGIIVLIILAVLGTCAFFGWAAWRVCQAADRAERDAKYRRRLLLVMVAPYAFGLLGAISDVLSGKQPAWHLVFLPISAAIIWVLVKAVKVPPTS
ncbi:MAG TPA: hypothetical protein VH437_13670 [Terriglobales bacterium]|jgi:hypothetical protein